MAGQQQQQGGQGDNSLGYFWIIVGLMAAVLLIWYMWHSIIVNIIFKIKLAEIFIIDFFTKSLEPLRTMMLTSPPEAVTFSQVMNISSGVGEKLAIPIMVIFIILSVLLYKHNTIGRYKKVHTMDTLANQEQENWPFIVPTRHIDLLSIGLDEGPWAMSMTPMQFAKKNKLLIEEKKAVGTSGLKRDVKTVVKVRKNKASRAFVKQLGPAWTNVWQLPLYMRALFAIFAAKAEGDREPANALLRQIAGSAKSHPIRPEKLNFAGADTLLKKHEKSKIVQKVIGRHAYVLTVMASMLEIARMDGVVATAEFIWLKPVDRSLWYMLNTIGRQTAPIEISGAIAHWLAEREIGRPMTIPMIEMATVALESAISEVIYIPDEQE